MNANPNQRLNSYIMNKLSIMIIALFILSIGIFGCSKEKEIVKSSNNYIIKSTVSDNFSPKLVCEEIISNGEDITTLLNSIMSFDEISVFYQNLQNIKSQKEYENYVISKLGEKKAVEFGILMNNTNQLFHNLRENKIGEKEISKFIIKSPIEPNRFPCKNERSYQACIEICESTFTQDRVNAVVAGLGAGTTLGATYTWVIGVGGGTPASLAGAIGLGIASVGTGTLTFATYMSAAINKRDNCYIICIDTYCY